MNAEIIASRFRFAVHILPREETREPEGRTLEQCPRRSGIAGIGRVLARRRVELVVDASDAIAARLEADRLAREQLADPLTERYAIEALGALSAARGRPGG